MEALKWSDSSFLIELKPNSDSANLFVACPKGSSREGVRVLSDGLEAGVLGEGGLEEDETRSSGSVRGILLHPESLSSLAWADNETVFTCRVRAESVDTVMLPKGSLQMSREIRGSMKLDQFCDSLRKTGAMIECIHCGEPLLAPEDKITKVYSLPSEDWIETGLDTLNFFCADNCCGSGGSSSGAGETEATTVKDNLSESECLVSESYFLFEETHTEDSVSTTSNRLIRCAHCLTELGVHLTNLPVKYNRFFHSAVKLKQVGSSLGYMNLRFESTERYFAWMLLTQSHNCSSLKFVVKSLEGNAKLLLWMLDSYSVMVRGSLRAHGDIDPVDQPWEPFTALKILYKVFCDADDDPRAKGQDHSVQSISEPDAVCNELSQLLIQSSQSLPPACRAVGQFYVGYLKMCDTLE